MIDQTAIDLSAHRLEKAKEALKQAGLLLDNDGYDGSVNRSYYAIFNAIRALLALVNLDSRKHSGVISFFDRYFVKTGIFEKSFSHIVHSAFDVRQVSDYEDYATPTAEQATQQAENAAKSRVISRCRSYRVKRRTVFFSNKWNSGRALST